MQTVTGAEHIIGCSGMGVLTTDGEFEREPGVKEFFGDLPLIGFFGNAKIAPVGGHNFAHNYTAVTVWVGEPF